MSADNSQNKRIILQCYQTGTSALNSQNWDYAIEMYSKCVSLDPDNKLYRQVLRGAERKKYNDNGKGAKLAGTKLIGVRGKIKKARAKEDWDAMDNEAETGLRANPWDAALNAAAGEACLQRGYLNGALFAYECAVGVEKDNKDYIRALAEVNLQKKNFDESARLWERLHKLDPLDSEARSKQNEIQSLKTIHQGQYDEAESTQDVKTQRTAYDEYTSGDAKDAVTTPGEDPIADFQRLIRKEPENTAYYQKLADLYRREGRLADSEDTLQKAYEISGKDQGFKELLEDVQLDRMRQEVDQVSEAAKENPDDEAVKEKRTSLLRQLLSKEVRVFSERIGRYPKDCRLKFELAKRYKKVRKWSEAIPLLQQAAADTRLESEVLVSLGECFLKENQTSIAKRQFERALPKINAHDKPDLFKACHYYLGLLNEKAGKREEAEEHFQDILAVDYNFKDVRERLEKLQSEDG